MAGRVRFQFATVDNAVQNLKKMNDYIHAGMDTAIDIAEDIIQIEKDSDAKKADDFKEMMQEYCTMERDLEQFVKAVEHVKRQTQQMGDEEESPDLNEMLNTKLAEIAQANTNDFTDHQKYTDLLEKISAVDEEDEQETPEPQTEEMGDDEIEVTQQELNTKCPYTGIEMVRPVKNRRCGHCYDRDGINEFIKQRGKRGAKCPVGGCLNQSPISKDDLVEDKAMKKYIEKKNKAKK